MNDRDSPDPHPEARRWKHSRVDHLIDLVTVEVPLYREHAFQRMIQTERKRADRTGRPFFLALIDLQRLLKQPQPDAFAMHLSDALHDMSRETDAPGWYHAGSVIGIIYTEIATGSRAHVLQRIWYSLVAHLSEATVHLVDVTCMQLPDSVAGPSLSLPVEGGTLHDDDWRWPANGHGLVSFPGN